MTVHELAAALLIVALIGAALTVVAIMVAAFARWANDRASGRTAAATFEAAYIPESDDVAA